MRDFRTFEVVTRDVRKHESAAKKLIGNIYDLRGTTKLTLAKADSVIKDIDDQLTAVASLQDELRITEFAVAANYIARTERDLNAIKTSVLEAASSLVARMSPLMALDKAFSLLDAVSTSLAYGGTAMTVETKAISYDNLTGLVYGIFRPESPAVDGAENVLTVVIGVTYPNTKYMAGTERYSASIVYADVAPHLWEAAKIHASYSVDLGHYSKQTPFKLTSTIANQLSAFEDVRMGFQKPFKNKPIDNELTPDDVCGMAQLPIAIRSQSEHDNSVTIVVNRHGDIRPTTLSALAKEIKRRLLALGIATRQLTVNGDATVTITTSRADVPLDVLADRVSALAKA